MEISLVWINCSFVVSKYLSFLQLVSHKCGALCALTPVALKLPSLPHHQCYPVKLAHKPLTEGGQGKIALKFRKQGKSALFCSIWIARDFRGPFSCLLAEEFYFGAGGASTQLFGTYASSRGLSHPQQLWLTVLVALKPLAFIFGVERLPHAPVFEYLVLGRWPVLGGGVVTAFHVL